MSKEITQKETKKYKTRELAMSGDKLANFKQGITRGLTITESLAFAGVSYREWRTYKKHNPDILEDIEVLKNMPSIKAKFNLVEELNKNNVQVSQWWLERKNAQEFCLKTINENKNETTLNIQMANFQSNTQEQEEKTINEVELEEN